MFDAKKHIPAGLALLGMAATIYILWKDSTSKE
jgi:hypothetical protein